MAASIITRTDSYKLSHASQYPPGTRNVASYFESRVGAQFDETVFFGLQYVLRQYLAGRVVDRDAIDTADSMSSIHFGSTGVFNRRGWEHVLDRHMGRLPVRVRAVPEGTVVPTSNVLMTVEVTDPKCWWLTNVLETLLVQVWYPSTVATLSREVKKVILHALKTTGCQDLGVVDFMLHDFGFRGVSSTESAGIGGLAHLVNFKGTDTLEAITTGIEHYGSGVCGFSIPASEHSTITSWGREREVDAYRNMLQTYPTGPVACVSDSYDIEQACHLWGTDLKEDVLARDGVLVVRPDSGDPLEVLPRVLGILGEHFGTSMTSTGHRLLNPKVRVIQGDGCDLTSIGQILDRLVETGWAAENLAFGMGGGLLQKLDRDTQRFAFKCCAVQDEDGVWRDVWKEPKTDPSKASKRGRLKLVATPEGVRTAREDQDGEDLLETVFENGELVRVESLDQIRRRASAGL